MTDKTKLLRCCDDLYEKAQIHTRSIKGIQYDTDFTEKETYSYWMGFKKAIVEIVLVIKGT
jgi:hypothetical protein